MIIDFFLEEKKTFRVVRGYSTEVQCESYYAVLYCIVIHCICTVLYCTVLYCKVL